jgi:hypothetical protein
VICNLIHFLIIGRMKILDYIKSYLTSHTLSYNADQETIYHDCQIISLSCLTNKDFISLLPVSLYTKTNRNTALPMNDIVIDEDILKIYSGEKHYGVLQR